MTAAPYETFPALTAIEGLHHGFIQRVPDLNVHVERELALALLAKHHDATIANIGLAGKKLIAAQQVHGNCVVRVDANTTSPVADCDGLLTNDPGVALAIYVADCGAIYLVDPVHQAIGLLHSGKKGTELGILTVAIESMRKEFGTDPNQLVVQLAPCIRPPNYEIDFAANVGSQARNAGVGNYADCNQCTAADPQKYYSYRRELGKTGRLLAVLGYA